MIKTFIQKRASHLALIALLFSFQSCRKENDTQLRDMQQDVSFSTSISGLPQTKAQGTQWEVDDAIAVYMYEAGKGLNFESLIEGADGVEYVTKGNGNFFAKDASQRLQFPAGQSVAFAAFYPYQNIIDLLTYMDVANQEDQAVIDYMLAFSDEGGISGGPVKLHFQRLMAKIEVTVKTEDASALKAILFDVHSEGEYNLEERTLDTWKRDETIAAKVTAVSATESKVEWTVFPTDLTPENKIVFTDGKGKTYTWNIAKDQEKLEQGHRYTYAITLGKAGEVKPKPQVSYFELPIITETPTLKYSMKSVKATDRRNYSMLFDTEQRIAHWVAYPLTKDYLGSVDRSKTWNFDYDYNNQNWQANLSKSYPDQQFDRGHQIASGDRTANKQENQQTFLYSNSTPQNKKFNGILWADLEGKVRTWAKGNGVDTLYVVTGAVATDPDDREGKIEYVKDMSNNNIAKPKYYYKALAMKKGDEYYTIGFWMQHKNTGNERNYMDYKVDVTYLEEKTGYTFFPALTKAEKATINTNIWR